MNTLGKLQSIKIITDLDLSNSASLEGTGGRLGLSQMLNTLRGYGTKDGYSVVTDKHTWLILIDNGQSCCESWGYVSSDENFDQFLGKEVSKVRLTDNALNEVMVKAKEDIYEGGIKFITFFFTDGSALQFAVYNSHNGYYGHDILFAKDKKIILNDVL